MSEIAFYAGWYDAEVSGPFAAAEVDFMPGAFAYHLHSFSAADLRSPSKHWVGPLLNKGVTASIGFVYEPYLGGTLNVGVFTARFVHEGFSLGEAAWAASPVLSWQMTVVGDPLYRPYGLNAQQLHERLAARGDSLIEWSHLRVVDLNLAVGTRAPEAINYLEENPDTKTSAVLSEKLGELYASVGKPNSAISTYRRALELATHRPQRVRLTLTLADHLLAQEKEQEAWDLLEGFGREFPEYQHQVALYRQMLDAAEKLNKEADAARLRQQIQNLEPPATTPGAEQPPAEPPPA
jgi:tetratricopeptide (TPR) repeat protein